MERFRVIERVFRDSCLRWGYEEVRTPTLEYLYLFTAAGTLTPGRLGKVYSFLDWDGWSGERVVLRPDGTIPIARYYIETMAGTELAKLFYVTNVFSFEETGRDAREKWQCGAELIGPGTTTADIELVIMALDTLKRLGLKDIELRLSHAGLIRALLASRLHRDGLSPEEQHKLFDRILDGDTQALTGANPGLARIVTPLLSLKGKSSGFLKNLWATFGRDLPELEAPLDNFTGFAGLLDSLGIKYEIDIASGRGFEYYTGMIFHLSVSGELVAGGGRYDALVPLLGGKDVPASGFALYLDKLMDMVGPGNIAAPAAEIVVVQPQSGADCLKEAFGLVGALHDAGHAAEVYLGTKGPADKKWRVEIRDSAPRFILRDMTKRRRFEAETVDEVLALLKSHGAK
jgi:histidyl-tRNA synthetase